MSIGKGLIAGAAAAFLFGTPKEMTIGDINIVIEQFVRAAKLAFDAGKLFSKLFAVKRLLNTDIRIQRC